MHDVLPSATLASRSDAPAGGSRKAVAALWVGYVLLGLIGYAAALYGIELRRKLYVATDPIRFTGDINNGWNWGRQAAREGVVELYDRLEREQAGKDRPDYGLDYPPARTWLVSKWAEWNAIAFPDVNDWQRDYEFSRPMLLANDVAELLSAGLVFFIVRRQVLVTASLTKPTGPGTRGKAVLIGFVGSLLLWFNAGVLFDAHAFPQWDLWIMPFFFGAVLAGMYDKFFVTGLLIGAGMTIKGQLLWAAPVLLLWPMLGLNWRGVIALLCGAYASLAAVTWPWLVRGGGAYTLVVVAFVLPAALLIYFKRWKWLYVPIGLAGLAALACPYCFGTSLSWWHVGYVYGSGKYPVLYTIGTSNLGTILQERYRFGSPTDLVDLPWARAVALKSIMLALTSVALLICGAGAALHTRRRDPRLLVALAAPFVIFYALMPQMHDRYLVWGAAATSLFVVLGVGWTLLHLVITGMMWLAIMKNLLHMDPDYWPALKQFVDGAHVDVGWALLLVVCILLYHAGPWGKRVAPIRMKRYSEEENRSIALLDSSVPTS